MTEADRAQLMAEYAKLSEYTLAIEIQAFPGRSDDYVDLQKRHLLRCSFFADMLEDME